MFFPPFGHYLGSNVPYVNMYRGLVTQTHVGDVIFLFIFFLLIFGRLTKNLPNIKFRNDQQFG